MTGSASDRDFASLVVGEEASFLHRLSVQDVDAFAELSGDYNPLHVDDAYAETTLFGKRIVHGMFLGALFSQAIGMQLPGTRSLLVRQSMEFKKPVFIGDEIEVKVMLAMKSEATRLVELRLTISRVEETVATGSAHVKVIGHEKS
jgi:acyl dehydratase